MASCPSGANQVDFWAVLLFKNDKTVYKTEQKT
jgi:hypothetical protein